MNLHAIGTLVASILVGGGASVDGTAGKIMMAVGSIISFFVNKGDILKAKAPDQSETPPTGA